jgi:hypothetical protein
MTTKLTPQKIWKGILHTEDENKHNYKIRTSTKAHENRHALKE